MGVTTWLDRITDETNVWLSAVKAEEGNELVKAADLYLRDACASVQGGSRVRAALSCFCAAECLSRAGADAGRLYFEAGLIYGETADAKVSTSIREALWALQRAYACFALSGDIREAERTREEFAVLSRRANPFTLGKDSFTLPEVMRTPSQVPVRESAGNGAREAMDKFLILRTKARGAGRPVWNGPQVARDRETCDEESIVSQLG